MVRRTAPECDATNLEHNAVAVGELLVLCRLDDYALSDVVSKSRQLEERRNGRDEGVGVLESVGERAAEERQRVEEAALLQHCRSEVDVEVAGAIVEIEGIKVVVWAVPDTALHHGCIFDSGHLLGWVRSAKDLACDSMNSGKDETPHTVDPKPLKSWSLLFHHLVSRWGGRVSAVA